MSAFKAYDIRGVWGKDIDEELCYRAGFFLPGLLGARQVIVGRDIRLSSPAAHEALTRGILDSGADVWDLGLATTPMVYYATAVLDADASVQITASHNSKEYNGLKISCRGALPVGIDTGLRELERLCQEGRIEPAAERGTVKDYGHMRESYISYMRGFVDTAGLRVVVDGSSGVTSLVSREILGTDGISYINDTFDGTFASHEPNPLDPANCRMLGEAVRAAHADIGVIYDGDGDRVVFTDEEGRFIQPDYMIAIIGEYYASKGITGCCVQDIRTSWSTTERLAKLGFDVHTWKVGHAFAKLKIRELDAVFGGELAGHFYFRDFFWCDSGIFASILVMAAVRALKAEGKTLSEEIRGIIRYANSGEVNFRIGDQDGAMKALCDEFLPRHPVRVMDFDGYRIEFSSWWFNVRKSNTEPLLRVVAEASSRELLDERMKEIERIISRFK